MILSSEPWFSGEGIYGPSKLFHSFWAGSIVRLGENGRSPRKTTWPLASRTWLVSHMTRARLEQRWDDERFRRLKISVLNYSATGVTMNLDKGYLGYNALFSVRTCGWYHQNQKMGLAISSKPKNGSCDIIKTKKNGFCDIIKTKKKWVLRHRQNQKMGLAISSKPNNGSCDIIKTKKWVLRYHQNQKMGLARIWKILIPVSQANKGTNTRTNN